jgi:hypothetical protein
MKSQLTYCAASILGLAVTTATVTPAEGVQIIYNGTGHVSKIEDFFIDGRAYDVTFQYDTFLNLFGYPNDPGFNAPTFWNNPQVAQQVVDNIALLLNNQQSLPTKINNSSSALVPYRGIIASNQSLYIVNKIDDYITRWSNFRGESKDIFNFGDEKANYAFFTPKKTRAIPENNLVIGVIACALIQSVITVKKQVSKKSCLSNCS